MRKVYYSNTLAVIAGLCTGLPICYRHMYDKGVYIVLCILIATQIRMLNDKYQDEPQYSASIWTSRFILALSIFGLFKESFTNPTVFNPAEYVCLFAILVTQVDYKKIFRKKKR